MKALLLILVLTTTAHATTLTFRDATIIIPDGSTITSETYEAPGVSTAGGRWIVTYDFTNGHGMTWDDYNDGGQGTVFFNTAVSNLIIHWISGPPFTVETNGQYYNACPGYQNCQFQGTIAFGDSGITSMLWNALHSGYGGIASMSYDVPLQIQAASVVPELPSWILTGIGLIMLAIFARKFKKL